MLFKTSDYSISSIISICAGLRQGSYVFLLTFKYIKYLHHVITDSRKVMFADDTTSINAGNILRMITENWKKNKTKYEAIFLGCRKSGKITIFSNELHHQKACINVRLNLISSLKFRKTSSMLRKILEQIRLTKNVNNFSNMTPKIP